MKAWLMGAAAAWITLRLMAVAAMIALGLFFAAYGGPR